MAVKPGPMGAALGRAVLRFERFPSIAELHDIACELQHQAQIKANSEWITRMREEYERVLRDGIQKSGPVAHGSR